MAKRMTRYKYQGEKPAPDPEAGPLSSIFWDNNGRVIHKWHHYLPIYHRHFAAFCNKPVKILEIGVFKGGSLDMWRKYFGRDAVIFGIDIDPSCAEFNGESGQVRIGSQVDHRFLSSVIEEMGGVDIVLDDGSHISSHMRASFECLFPKLNNGGVYMVEDLHATYWRSHKPRFIPAKSFMTDIKQLVDDMHHWYHGKGETNKAAAGHLYGMHLYDSIAVFEKRPVEFPVNSKTGATYER